MNLTVISILLIAIFQQQSFAQIAPRDNLFYEYMNPYMNSLKSSNGDILTSYVDERSWKRALGPRPLRFG